MRGSKRQSRRRTGHFAGHDPLVKKQRYLYDERTGFGVLNAWKDPAGRGSGLRFAVIEQGFGEHPDLEFRRFTVDGVNKCFHDHGTRSLGVVAAARNGAGVQGIAWDLAEVIFVSQFRDTGNGRCIDSVEDAIRTAARTYRPHVLLIQAQDYDARRDRFLPIERQAGVYRAIRRATSRGIVVIEPAGNGGLCLDEETGARGAGLSQRRRRDSGAVLVGAATIEPPHVVHRRSNWGDRVDCYAWGDGIFTSTIKGDRWDDYFGQTSGAAAIIAGLSLLIHGLWRARTGRAPAPLELRDLLRTPGRTCFDAAGNPVGVMPELATIVPVSGRLSTRR